MKNKTQLHKIKGSLTAAITCALLGLHPGSAFAGTIDSSADAPQPAENEVYLYNQGSGIESGKIISMKKLLKDVQDFPTDGSASVLLTFTVEGSGMAMVHSMTVQISKSAMGLGDNAALEVALYKNADPADSDFLSTEVIGEIKTFDAAGLMANDGDYVTLTFDEPVPVEAGVQHGFALHWTLDSVAPDTIDIDALNLRLARTNKEDVVPGEGYSLLTPEKMSPFTFPPDFSKIVDDDPVLIIIGGMSQGGVDWGGIVGEASDPNLVNTGDWMGWIYVDGDWVFSYSLSKWLYAPDPGADASGAWVFSGL